MNDLTTQQGAGLPATMPTGSWGAENVSSQDVIIPSIYLMHEKSDLVTNDKAKAGSFVHSTTNETLATKEQKLELIPITMFKQWIINELVMQRDGKEKPEFMQYEPMTLENENLPKEDFLNGKKIQRVRSMNFLCLIPSKLEEFPFLVRFKKTGYFAGKKLATHFQTARMKGLPPAHQIWLLSSKRQTTNDNTYFVPEVEPGRETKPEELQKAYFWFQQFGQPHVKVADEAFPYGDNQ